jgi:hypothetical protein
MASPESGLRSIADQPTRQQLDELDALMKRMLALPVTDSEGATKTPALARPYEPTAQPNHANEREPSQSGTSQPQAGPQPQIDEQAPPGADDSAQVWQSIRKSDRIQFVQSVPAPVPVPRLKKATGRPSTKDIQAAEATAYWLSPLVTIDRLFNRCVCLLGRFGSWLRQPYGKALLAGTGIVLLLAALGWVMLDWSAWTW